MGLFSRGTRKSDDADPEGARTHEVAPGSAQQGGPDDPEAGSAASSSGPDHDGPLDRSLVSDDTDFLNLGSIWLRGQQGLELRLELDENEQQITGVTAVIGDSAVQLQAFAAPRTEGVWFDIRDEIAASIDGAGGTAEVVTGPFGEELQTRMPQAGPDGRTVFMPARFVGVDGPRWFLRAVISGRAAVEPEAATQVHDLVRTAVVDRGDEAMPPRELLPLRLPPTAEGTGPEVDDEQAFDAETAGSADSLTDGGPASLDDFTPFERGPEITEVR